MAWPICAPVVWAKASHSASRRSDCLEVSTRTPAAFPWAITGTATASAGPGALLREDPQRGGGLPGLPPPGGKGGGKGGGAAGRPGAGGGGGAPPAGPRAQPAAQLEAFHVREHPVRREGGGPLAARL